MQRKSKKKNFLSLFISLFLFSLVGGEGWFARRAAVRGRGRTGEMKSNLFFMALPAEVSRGGEKRRKGDDGEEGKEYYYTAPFPLLSPFFF